MRLNALGAAGQLSADGKPGDGRFAVRVVGGVDHHPCAGNGRDREAGRRGGEQPEGGMADPLGIAGGQRHVVGRPERGEVRVQRLESTDEVRPGRVADVPTVGRAQLGDECSEVLVLLGYRVAARADEAGEQRVALGRRCRDQPGEQGGVDLVPGEQVEALGEHASRVRDGVEDALHLGRQRTLNTVRRRRCPRDVGEAEQVAALGGVQSERVRDRVEDLDAGIDRAALLKPRVPGDAHASQVGQLLAPQAYRAAAGADREPDVLRADPLPAAAQERGELGPARDVAGGVVAAVYGARVHL
jgi:hypothetical protein